MKFDFPKVDLHLHLDGSLDLKLSYALAKERNLIAEDCNFEEFTKKIVVTSDNRSLEDFLKRFDLPIAILQDEEALCLSSRELIKKLALQGLAYVEVRFAPQFHTQKGLNQHQAVKAVLKGIRIATSEHPQIEAGLILCMMTLGDAAINRQANLETIAVAKDFLGKGVVAIDLAGAEASCPMTDYQECFDLANQEKIPYLIHAGESGPASSVQTALNFNALRIGHGGHCTEDEAVMQEVIERKIPLELCLTSNVQCHNQPSYSEHALKKLMAAGVICTLNTDNMTISMTNLDQEYEKAVHYLGLTQRDLIHLNINSVKASFMPEDHKQLLIKRLMEKL